MQTDKTKSNKKIKKLSKKAKRLLILSVILLLLFAFAISIFISNFSLKVTEYACESKKINIPLRLALISDLHLREYGQNNIKLIDKIQEQNPDLIFIVGDMVSYNSSLDTSLKYVDTLVSSLKEIAPTYFSVGNHERFHPQKAEIISAAQSAGGILLDSEYTDINLNGTCIRIGGISYYRSWDEESNKFLKDFCDVKDNVYTLLLCHFPEFYSWGIKNYPIDLMLSGHTHGGMVKLPLIGPLYAPEQGWFPDYAAGFYETEYGYLAVTTGLSSSPGWMPRIFNRPEIMIIDLK